MLLISVDIPTLISINGLDLPIAKQYLSPSSEYGFAEKVVEGMSLSINSIVIRISAKAFNASFELSQLQVYSVNTSWSISDLRFTRIQDPQRGEVCIFLYVGKYYSLFVLSELVLHVPHFSIYCLL